MPHRSLHHLSVAPARSGAFGVGFAGVHGVVRFGGVAPLSTAFFGFFISRLRLSRFPRFPIVNSLTSSIFASIHSPRTITQEPLFGRQTTRSFRPLF